MSELTTEEIDNIIVAVEAAIEAGMQREWLPNVGVAEHPDGYNGPCGCDDCYRAN